MIIVMAMDKLDKFLLVVGNLLIAVGLGATVLAQSQSSTSYKINESYIGPGGSLNSSSPGYKESSTVGDTATGNSSSSGYQTNSGGNTTSDPRLSMVVNTSSINFGGLSTAVAKTATSSFAVLNYTSSGYVVFTVGDPPSNGSHVLTGINPTAASQVGVEQFGINLQANTSPISFGADPVQVPSGSFSFGAASSGYNSANTFRYVNGEGVAGSVKTSGETDYTISYIVNVATTTPGGSYTGGQALVVVGTY